MAQLCEAEIGRLNDAKDSLDDAKQDRDNAQEAYDDAGGFFDDSTFWDVAAGATVAAACLSNPFSWLVCGAGIIAGAAGLTASEKSRHDEIEAAEEALQRADQAFWTANDRFYDRYDESLDCISHALTKIQIPP